MQKDTPVKCEFNLDGELHPGCVWHLIVGRFTDDDDITIRG